MAFERFTKDARAAVLAASSEEARSRGDGTVEAEHLLLALVDHPDLRGYGLDRQQLVAALEEEEERSLAAVGIAGGDFDLSSSRGRPRKPKLSTSAKLALHRAVTFAVKRGDRRVHVRVRHLLAGVLAAEQGRVPRALQIAAVDVDHLRAQL